MRTFALLGVFALLPVSAMAGVLADDTTAYNDGTTSWHGSVLFTTGSLSATVDYAVYAPGTFPFAGYTPDPGEFAYAYQVFVAGSSSVNKFSVGMSESNEANDIGSFPLSGGIVPSKATFGSTDPEALDTADWEWGGGLAIGAFSSGLVFSSVNAPIWAGASVHDSGLFAVNWMASPSDVIPEPATIGLLAAGLLALRRRR